MLCSRPAALLTLTSLPTDLHTGFWHVTMFGRTNRAVNWLMPASALLTVALGMQVPAPPSLALRPHCEPTQPSSPLCLLVQVRFTPMARKNANRLEFVMMIVMLIVYMTLHGTDRCFLLAPSLSFILKTLVFMQQVCRRIALLLRRRL